MSYPIGELEEVYIDYASAGSDRLARAIRSAITRLREGSGTGVRASVYVVEEAEGQIWLSAGGLQASTRIDSPMGQALQRLDTELRAPVSPSPSKVDEVVATICRYPIPPGALLHRWGEEQGPFYLRLDDARGIAQSIIGLFPPGGRGGSETAHTTPEPTLRAEQEPDKGGV